MRGVQQNRGPGPRVIENIHPLDEVELVACDEAGVSDQIGRTDRVRTETKMGDRHRPRLLRVVHEVSLHVEVGFFADDLDRILVGADRSVCSEAEEDGSDDRVGLDVEFRIPVERKVGHVVDDSDRETPSRRLRLKLVVDRFRHRGRELLARETVPAGDDSRHCERQLFEILGLTKCGDNIEIERITDRSRLLRPIEYRDRPDARRQRTDEVLHRERTIQPHRDDPYPLTPGSQILDRFANRLDTRAHQHDDTFRLRMPEVLEQTVPSSRARGEIGHRIGNMPGAGVVEEV